MDIEHRIAALEAKVAEEQTKREALRNGFIALQFTLMKLLPVISAPQMNLVREALTEAYDSATLAMTAQGYDEAERRDVRASMDDLLAKILGAPHSSLDPPERQ